MREHYPHQRPEPRQDWRDRAAIVAVAGVVALLGFIVYQAIEGVRHWIDPYADPLLPPWFTTAALILLLAAGALWLLGVYTRWASRPAAYADKVISLADAQRAIPRGVVSLSYHDSSRPQPPALVAPSEEAPALPAAALPTFAELLDRGRVGKGNPLLLGYDVADGQELTGSWLDLYSTAVSGMPGSGKTTSQRFLACQTALHGAKFAICDPHAGAADDSLAATLAPLSAAFVCEPASSDKAILDVVRYVADVGRRRVEGKDSSTTPLILWVDELTALLGRSSVAAPLAELLEQVAQEYRKRWVFVCASGQIWTAARTSSELRDSFASVLCHRMKRAQARLLLPTEEAEQVERLEIGRAVLWRTSGATSTIAIPNTTAGDVARVATLLTSAGLPREPLGGPMDTAGKSDRRSSGSLTDSQPIVTSSASERASAPSAVDARILSLFADGNDAAEIVRQLWPDTKPGRATQERSAQVQAAIRQALIR